MDINVLGLHMILRSTAARHIIFFYDNIIYHNDNNIHFLSYVCTFGIFLLYITYFYYQGLEHQNTMFNESYIMTNKG